MTNLLSRERQSDWPDAAERVFQTARGLPNLTRDALKPYYAAVWAAGAASPTAAMGEALHYWRHGFPTDPPSPPCVSPRASRIVRACLTAAFTQAQAAYDRAQAVQARLVAELMESA